MAENDLPDRLLGCIIFNLRSDVIKLALDHEQKFVCGVLYLGVPPPHPPRLVSLAAVPLDCHYVEIQRHCR